MNTLRYQGLLLIRRGLWAALLVCAAPTLAAESDDEADPGGPAVYWPGGQEYFDSWAFEIRQGSGMVTELDFDGPVVVIEGVRYGFAVNPDIRFLEGMGAPTLLEPGMTLEFYYSAPDFADQAGKIQAMIEFPAAAYEPE